MTCISVECPECHRGFVVSGRGRCRCGAYLAYSWSGRSFIIPFPPERTWVWIDDVWHNATDLPKGGAS